MTTRKTHYVGQLQRPGARPENVELILDERGNLTKAESAAGIEWVNPRYKVGHVLRYRDNTDPGTTDMTAAFNAPSLIGVPGYAPAGTYKVSSLWTIDEIFFEGDGADKTIIEYSGTGFCCEVISSEQHAGLSKVRLNSTTTTQSGLLVHGTMSKINNLYIQGFDQYQLRLGDGTNSKGSYWGEFNNIRIQLPVATNGDYGLYVDGVTPASNDNVLKNVVISGNYEYPLVLDGNGNKLINGTIEMTRGDENVVTMIRVNGSGNRILDPYIEPVIDPAPDTICSFGSDSVGNIVRVWPQFSWTTNCYDAITDLGAHNEFYAARRTATEEISSIPTGLEANLLPNSNFAVWRDTNNPTGWYSGTARCTKETTTIKGGVAAIKMAESSSNSTISCYLNDYFSSTSKALPYPLEFLVGRNVVCGVWVKTTVAGAGGVRFTWVSTGGETNHQGNTVSGHSGGGDWELIVASGRIPTDATRVQMELRSHPINTNITGDVYFSEPFFNFGTKAMVPAPRYITDNGAKMHGDLEFMEDGLADTDSAFLILNGSYLWVDSTGDLRIHTSRPTNLDSNGTVVGTQT